MSREELLAALFAPHPTEERIPAAVSPNVIFPAVFVAQLEPAAPSFFAKTTTARSSPIATRKESNMLEKPATPPDEAQLVHALAAPLFATPNTSKKVHIGNNRERDIQH